MGCRRWCFAVALVSAVAAAVTAAAAAPPRFDYEVLSHALPSELEAGSRLAVDVTLANLGDAAWAPDDGFALSYHWFAADGGHLQWDGRRTPLPRVVAGGERVSLTAEVEVPRHSGRLALQWDVVEEGVRWLSEVDPTPPPPVAVVVVASHAFALGGDAVPRLAVAGTRRTVDLVLTNRGVRTWSADGSFALAYHWLARDGSVRVWEGRRSPVPRPAAPGDSVEVTAELELPDRPGLYRLQWDMVEEGVCWFSEGSEPRPGRTVLVLPGLGSAPLAWSLLSLLAAIAVVGLSLGGRAKLPAGVVALVATADLLWLVGGLVVKQAALLAAGVVEVELGGVLAATGGAAWAALLLLLLPSRWRAVGCWLAALAASALLWADLLYLRFFHDLPGPGTVLAAGQASSVAASIRELAAPGDAWLWLDLLPGLVLVVVSYRLRTAVGPAGRRVAAAVFAGLALAAAGWMVSLAVRQPALFEQVFRRLNVAREVGVLNLQAAEAASAAVRGLRADRIGEEELASVAAWFEERAPSRAGRGPWFGAARGRSLVMVQVESLQGFVIGLEVGGREVTPFLNRWRGQALWFSNVTDQTLQGRSSDSELATQASLLPAGGAAAAFRFADNDFTGLAEILGRHGYRTLSAVPYEGGFWNRRATHRAYGFASSLFVEDFAGGEQVGWGLSDRDFLAQMARRLGRLDGPWAAYLLTLSLHHPFDGFPAHLKALDVGGWEGTAFGNYLHTMHHFDASLAAFVAALEVAGGGGAVVAVWGDHDAGFEWRPEIAAAAGFDSSAAGWYLSQEVPLFVQVPGVDGLAGERSAAAGHVDVAPTLLALLGIDPAPFAFVGRNMLGEPGERPVVGEYGCWRDDRLLFLQGDDGTLTDGRCIEIATMALLPPSRCAAGWRAALRSQEVSALVLEHDLQERLHGMLAGRAGGP